MELRQAPKYLDEKLSNDGCKTPTACQTPGCLYVRRDQLIPVNKAANKKVQLEKGLEEEEEKNWS
jgi:hypothetical protein